MKSIIVGEGEVGTALYRVLKPYYDVSFKDDLLRKEAAVDVLHICYYTAFDFVSNVKIYKELCSPQHTVIHSTVPVGTSAKCNATHSPVIGMHPFLEESLRTFTKFVGGPDADAVAEYFRRAGMKVYVCRKSETTELAKLLSTTFYATCIEYVKEAERLCDEAGVPFSEAFTLFQQAYNEGYVALGYPGVQRPVLVPLQHKQGGHCTLANCELLQSQFAKFVLTLNSEEK